MLLYINVLLKTKYIILYCIYTLLKKIIIIIINTSNKKKKTI